MPIKLSDLMISDEKWNSMTEEERLRAIREGRINSKRIKQIQESGTEAEKAVVQKFRVGESTGLRNAFEANDVYQPELFRPVRVELPRLRIPPLTASEIHSYESAGVLIKRLNQRYKLWVEQLPADVQPVIYVVLANGAVIKVLDFEEEGHNGIAVYGEIEGGPCWVMTHQASLQLIWVGEKVEEASPRRTIGFRTTEDSGGSPKL
jgi:hypothetical protein